MIYRLDYLNPINNLPYACIVDQAELKWAVDWLIKNNCQNWKVVDTVIQIIIEQDDFEPWLGTTQIINADKDFARVYNKFGDYRKT